MARWAQYRAESVDLTLSERDGMLVAGQLDHYLWAGTSALEIISEAMLLARKTPFHKFFPDSEIFVSKIDKAKQALCVNICRAGNRPSTEFL